ncbi:MAG: type II toxin-antitoxin system RelE/ParE family toxin [Thermodesulfobacteriota bacterium]
MSSILITPAAENDLINIWLYIAEDNEGAANRLYEAAQSTFELIISSPKMGTLYRAKRVRLQGLRFFPIQRFQNYMVYYKEITDGIEIIRVLHGHMLQYNHLEPRGH